MPIAETMKFRMDSCIRGYHVYEEIWTAVFGEEFKSHEIKNVTDFNVADSVRRDIKVLATKTRYTVLAVVLQHLHACCIPILPFAC